MSTSCNIYLPNDVRFNDVCSVIGILLGHKKNGVALDNECSFCHVYNVYSSIEFEEQDDECRANIWVRGTNMPGYIIIMIKDNPIDHEFHEGSFHYETSNNMRLISGGSNDFWHQVGKGLVEFFGGYVDYNDCDDIEKDFESNSMREINNPTHDLEWDLFQTDLFELLSLEERKS